MTIRRTRRDRISHLVATRLLAALLFPILLSVAVASANETLVESLSHK